jgi:hypothetical protein
MAIEEDPDSPEIEVARPCLLPLLNLAPALRTRGLAAGHWVFSKCASSLSFSTPEPAWRGNKFKPGVTGLNEVAKRSCRGCKGAMHAAEHGAAGAKTGTRAHAKFMKC